MSKRDELIKENQHKEVKSVEWYKTEIFRMLDELNDEQLEIVAEEVKKILDEEKLEELNARHENIQQNE